MASSKLIKSFVALAIGAVMVAPAAIDCAPTICALPLISLSFSTCPRYLFCAACFRFSLSSFFCCVSIAALATLIFSANVPSCCAKFLVSTPIVFSFLFKSRSNCCAFSRRPAFQWAFSLFINLLVEEIDAFNRSYSFCIPTNLKFVLAAPRAFPCAIAR